MATIKVKFRPSATNGSEGTIYYLILKDRRQRRLSSDYHILPEEWDKSRSALVIKRDNPRKILLLSVKERIRRDLERTKIKIPAFNVCCEKGDNFAKRAL